MTAGGTRWRKLRRDWRENPARARGFYERLGYAVTKAQNVFDKSLE